MGGGREVSLPLQIEEKKRGGEGDDCVFYHPSWLG